MAAPLPCSFCFPPKSEAEEKQDVETYQKYIKLAKALPESHGLPYVLQQHQGFWGVNIECVMAAQDHFTSLPGDVLLCTPPKVGTTWLKALAFAVVNRTNAPFPLSSLLFDVPHWCVPNIEMQLYDGQRIPRPDLIPSPRLLATHIHHHMLPKTVTDHAGACKIVYLCRNPRDTFISLWKFVSNSNPNFTWGIEQALDSFVRGVVFGGPYWDHVKGYWEASKVNPEKVLFMRYEELQKDTATELKRLSVFIGCPFSEKEEKEGTVEKKVEMCSFKNLSSLKVNVEGVLEKREVIVEGVLEKGARRIKNSAFFRKGMVGDWKNHMTTEMVERLDLAVEEKLEGCGLTFVGSYDS